MASEAAGGHRGSGQAGDGQPRRRRNVRAVSRKVQNFSRNYSHFVRLTKFMLPAVAGSLVLLVALWPEIAGDDSRIRIGMAKIDISQADNVAMVNARYQGIDGQRQRYNLRALTASKSPTVEDGIELDSPQADLAMSDGTWLAMHSETGLYIQETQQLDLFGGVELFHDEGHTFRTQTAHVDLQTNDAKGDAPVSGHGPAGHVDAENGFRIVDGGARILFLGRSRLVMNPESQDRLN